MSMPPGIPNQSLSCRFCGGDIAADTKAAAMTVAIPSEGIGYVPGPGLLVYFLHPDCSRLMASQMAGGERVDARGIRLRG